MSALSIQEKQAKCLKRMLRGGDEDGPMGEWKVLIYDRSGRDILLPLFSVAELKDQGVTERMIYAKFALKTLFFFYFFNSKK